MPEKLWSKKMLTVLGIQWLWLLVVVGVFSTPALAHRVLVFAYAEGDTIHTESKFVSDSPVRQGKVLVLDAKTGRELLTGKTDDQGKFSFKIPAAAAAEKLNLRIVTEAAMGHRGEWLLKAESYLGGVKTASAPGPAPAASTTSAATAAPAVPAAKTVSLDQEALEVALNKALERQLAPINEKLTELSVHRTSLPDILGGIGYILGFFGVWAYFQSKRKTDS